jgi:hypothetical protein
MEVVGFFKTSVNFYKTAELQMIWEQGREMEKSVKAYVWEESLTVVGKLTDLGKLRAKFK